MAADTALTEARDEVLRKIGRNLESCQELGAALDEQNAKVLPAFDALRAIVLTLCESQREAAQYLAPEEFFAELRKGTAGAE